MGGFDDVPTGSTWSWLPAACAAALATLDLYEREPVLENVRELERLAAERLAELRDRFEAIGDVRAVGCFLAIEFVRDRETRERATGAPGRGRRRDVPARRDRRLEHHLAQPPAVAGDAGRGARARVRRSSPSRSRRRSPASRGMTALEAELRAELERDARGRDAEADPGAALRPGAGGRDRGPRRGPLPLLQRLPRPRQPSGGRRAPAPRGSPATAPGPPRSASSAARSRPTSSSSATSPPSPGPRRRSPTSPAGTPTPPCSTRSATSARRSSPTASTTPRSSTACGSRARPTRRSTSTPTSTTCAARWPRRRRPSGA